MEPKEIFELIVKADEKLKYATAEKSGARGAARRAICSSRRATRRARSGTTRWSNRPSSRLADLA